MRCGVSGEGDKPTAETKSFTVTLISLFIGNLNDSQPGGSSAGSSTIAAVLVERACRVRLFIISLARAGAVFLSRPLF